MNETDKAPFSPLKDFIVTFVHDLPSRTFVLKHVGTPVPFHVSASLHLLLGHHLCYSGDECDGALGIA